MYYVVTAKVPNLKQGEIPWMIRVKGAYEINAFPHVYLRERRVFLYDIALYPCVQKPETA